MITPDQITQIVETIKTLNLNIDSASAVQIVEVIKPILWMATLRSYFVAILTAGVILCLFILIYKIFKKVNEQWNNDEKMKEVEKFLEELEDWGSVKSIKEMLQEIIEYMPKNKKKRKI